MAETNGTFVIKSAKWEETLQLLLSPPPSLWHHLQHFNSLSRVKIVEDRHSSSPNMFKARSSQLWSRSSRPTIVALDVHCETSAGLEGSMVWMSACASSLSELRLHIGRDVGHSTFLTALRALDGHLPKLTTLELSAELEYLHPGERIDLALGAKSMCECIRTLETLRLQLDIVDGAPAAFFEALSRLCNLKQLYLFSSSALPQGTELMGTIAQPPSNIAAVTTSQKLRVLDIAAPAARCIALFSYLSVSVTELELAIPNIRDSNELRDVLSKAMSATPQTGPLPNSTQSSGYLHMSDAQVDAMFGLNNIPEPQPTSCVQHMTVDIHNMGLPRLDLTTLAPLSRALGMNFFSIRCPMPLSYTSQNLLDMFQSWASIQHLSLNPRPVTHAQDSELHVTHRQTNDNTVPPSLDILTPVAQSAPCLKTFRAFLSCSSPPALPPNLRTWAPQLLELDLGFSVPANADPLDAGKVRQHIEHLFPKVEIVTENCSAWVNEIAAAPCGGADSPQ